MAKCACEALGSIAVADDLGNKVRVRLHIDLAVAISILERRCRPRTPFGYRRPVAAGTAALPGRQIGIENPADVTTKHLAQGSVNKRSSVFGYQCRRGRSATLAKLHQV